MEMRSFVARVDEIFSLLYTREENNEILFGGTQKYYNIPKYQREYKWHEERVVEFIKDINEIPKFLGNIILKDRGSYYDIVDGQQRMTTLLLLLLYIFNRNGELGRQQYMQYLYHENSLLIRNETIGDYVIDEDGKKAIRISETDDIYRQKSKFIEIAGKIEAELNDMLVDDRALESFSNKLLSCKILVLLSSGTTPVESIEQVFLDINFKSQTLDVEDIFKGYCFKNFTVAQHDYLKNIWTKIKEHGFDFTEKFGYKDLSHYLYLYFLSNPSTYDLKENLTINKQHILDGKSVDETDAILKQLKEFGDNIQNFSTNISSDNYIFQNMCNDAIRDNDLNIVYSNLKKVCKEILFFSGAHYHKLFFLKLINRMRKNDSAKTVLSLDKLKRIISNYYMYSSFFIFTSERVKSKSVIPQNIITLLYADEIDYDVILDHIKELRRNIIREYLPNYATYSNFSTNRIFSFYSIVDFFDSRMNYVSNIYLLEDNYNQEHLIVNQSKKIVWKYDAGKSPTIKIVDLLHGEPAEKKSKVKNYMAKLINSLVTHKNLNAKLESFDIIEKIKRIRARYVMENKIPKHMKVIIDYLEQMPSYLELSELKQNSITDLDIIKEKYSLFIQEFFSETNEATLLLKINQSLKSTLNIID